MTIQHAFHLIFFLLLLFPRSLRAEERLVILNPVLVEIAYSLGLGSQIVGAVEFADYPEAAKKLPRVGSYLQPQIEKIVALNPTRVLALREGVDQISEPLARAHIPAHYYSAKSIGEFESLTQEVCQDLSAVKICKAQRGALLEKWNSEWNRLPKAIRAAAVLVQVDHEPLIVAGGQTFLSEIVERCGHKNIYGDLSGYPRPALETLHNRKVDVVVVLGQMARGVSPTQISSFWANLPMTAKTKIVFATADDLGRLGPRLPKAAAQLCEKIKGVLR